MSAAAIDSSFAHLYPVFRSRLKQVLAQTAAETGREWRMAEGFRSQERQSWLYASGRSRPGPVVTWMKHPTNHGAGLAADCYPKTGIDDRAPYEVYRRIYQGFGLSNPAWAKGDLGHVQLVDEAMRLKAVAWVQSGFPPGAEAPDPPPAELKAEVNGIAYPYLPVELIDGHAWVGLRALLPLLHLVIERLDSGLAQVVSGAEFPAGAPEPEAVLLPLQVLHGTGYVQASLLAPFAAVGWDAARRTVTLKAK